MLLSSAVGRSFGSMVSILIRPFDRMLPAGQRDAPLSALQFQSSSGPSTGCCFRSRSAASTTKRFQSSSGPSTGCCLGLGGAVSIRVYVSILIRPFDRMLLGVAVVRFRPGQVSILIRPFDRMLQRMPPTTKPTPICFNPHPALRPDAALVYSLFEFP